MGAVGRRHGAAGSAGDDRRRGGVFGLSHLAGAVRHPGRVSVVPGLGGDHDAADAGGGGVAGRGVDAGAAVKRETGGVNGDRA